MRLTIGASALVLAASGAGHAMVTDLDADLRRVDPFDGLTSRPAGGGGVNILVVGTDQREGISAAQQEKLRLGGSACDCTDTLMLVHLSADRERASVVSLPRDTYTELPAHRDRTTGKRVAARPAKLNSAYTTGGPKLTVRAVERLTRLRVDHYLEVDFTSFMRTVDVLGGVPVCTRKPLKDSHSGLDLPAGTTKLDGGQALQYVRARHLGDGSDLGRMKRQQRFLASVVARATDRDVLMNPVRFNKVARTLLDSVRADRGFDSAKMMALGQAMRGFSPASSEFASVPVADPGHRVPGLGSTVRWNRKKADRLFAALRADRPLADAGKAAEGEAADREAAANGGKAGTPAKPARVEVAPGGIRVKVENGTEVTGLGRRIDRELRGTGFATTQAPGNASRSRPGRTTIAYDPGWDRSARSLAAALPGAELVRVAGQGPLLRVVVGNPEQEVRPVRANPLADHGDAPVRGDKVGCD
ncbi:LCP family protein [Streptomyces boncukensis]|uniref:LCP family protein n=1 Tax=Streptomyces boncukensis TaxID=2711219 RepID=A0A6G4X3Q5_9ACTN|nr:LCP family protein [Streptomyces boncukensis]NGO71301.1 LCP family protein [Streptomyces boncukensis]